MATLKLSFNSEKVKDIELDKEVITIGRKNDNDIHIDNLSVSGHHAKITTLLNDSCIEDLQSTNGTYINGIIIKKQSLIHGDIIRIGKHELVYDNAEARAEDNFEHTMIIRPDTEGMPEHESSQAIEQSVGKIAAEIAEDDKNKTPAPASGEARIILKSGANIGKELPLTKVLTTLGKPGVQVAAITRRPAGYFLIHVDGGGNETRPMVNNQQIGIRAEPLHNGDIIEVANVEMEFVSG
ncbi:MAG: FHA domain-containing protein [Gammaproteobacteria bacterium]